MEQEGKINENTYNEGKWCVCHLNLHYLFYNHPLSTYAYGINFSEPRILLS